MDPEPAITAPGLETGTPAPTARKTRHSAFITFSLSLMVVFGFSRDNLRLHKLLESFEPVALPAPTEAILGFSRLVGSFQGLSLYLILLFAVGILMNRGALDRQLRRIRVASWVAAGVYALLSTVAVRLPLRALQQSLSG